MPGKSELLYSSKPVSQGGVRWIIASVGASLDQARWHSSGLESAVLFLTDLIFVSVATVWARSIGSSGIRTGVGVMVLGIPAIELEPLELVLTVLESNQTPVLVYSL